MLNSESETKKRFKIVNTISEYVKSSSLSGLLVTGSLAWGKNYAVTDTSDIDFYLIAPSVDVFKSSIANIPLFPKLTITTFNYLINHKSDQIDTVSMKTKMGRYNGAVYLFTENDIAHLVDQLYGLDSKFFKNLRSNNITQTKEYKSFNGNSISFTTPISKLNKDSQAWVRTDPLFLIKSKQFYGSIFLAHLLYGNIIEDKKNCIYLAQKKARHFLKSCLPKTKESAFLSFKKHLPRVERMNKETIDSLFESIWLS